MRVAMAAPDSAGMEGGSATHNVPNLIYFVLERGCQLWFCERVGR